MATPESNPLDAASPLEPSQPLAVATGSALFEAVQGAQGFAFISDDGDDLPPEKVLERARASLHWTNETAKILRRFIRRHSPNTKAEPRAAGEVEAPGSNRVGL